MSKETVAKVIEIVDSLPSLPDTLRYLQKIRDSETSGFNEAAKVIENDPGLTVDLLKFANSALYGFPQRVDSVGLALRMIGLDTFVNYVLTIFSITSIQNLFNNSENLRKYVKHSRQCAECAKIFGEYLNYPKKSVKQLYLGGIIHDIGRLVLKSLKNTVYLDILKNINTDYDKLTSVEKELFGMDHSEVGQMVLEKWNFPKLFINIVRYHHAPLEAKYFIPECVIIFLSNFFIIDFDDLNVGELFSKDLVNILDLTPEDFVKIYDLCSDIREGFVSADTGLVF